MPIITRSDDERLTIYECSENCEEHQHEILDSLRAALSYREKEEQGTNNCPTCAFFRRQLDSTEKIILWGKEDNFILQKRIDKLISALEVIAAQDSGVPGSSNRSDCMAIMAKLALRDHDKELDIINKQLRDAIMWACAYIAKNHSGDEEKEWIADELRHRAGAGL